MKGLHNASLLLLSALLSVQKDCTQAQVMNGDLPAVGSVVDSCSVCPNGIDVNEGNMILIAMQGNDAMEVSDPLLLCEQTVESSKIIEADSDMCLEMKSQTEMMCCPTFAANPCPIVCPYGICNGGDNPAPFLFGAMGESLGDNSTDGVVIGLSSNGISDMIVDSGKSMGADYDECQEALNGASCCPPPAIENPAAPALAPPPAPAPDVAPPPPPAHAHDPAVAPDSWGTCNFCPNGITSDENYYLTLGLNETEAADAAVGCQQMAGLAQMFEEGTEGCTMMAISCCPGTQVEVEGKCSFCKDGITLDENSPFFAGRSESDIAELGAMCEQMKGCAPMFKEGSDSCNEMDQRKMTCCPDPLENGCNPCPNGISGDGNPMIGDNEMCQWVISYLNTFEAESEECKQDSNYYEMLCCPTHSPTPPEDPCTICPNGIVPIEAGVNVNNNPWIEEHPFIDNEMCQLGISHLNMFEAESEECKQDSDYYEMLCCPTPLKNPCTICPNGIVPIEEHPFIDFVGENEAEQAETHVCSLSIGDYAQFEADSDMCLEVTDYLSLMCCPTEHENSCLVCPSGVTVPADDEFYDQCIQNIEFAKIFVEAGTEMCNGMFQSHELYCCPMPASNPCSVCPEGYSLNEDTVITRDDYDDSIADIDDDYDYPKLTCGASLYIEEGSLMCKEGKGDLLFQAICCLVISDPIQALPSSIDPVEIQETTTSPTEDSMSTNAPTASSTDDILSTNTHTASSTNDNLSTKVPAASTNNDTSPANDSITKAPTVSSPQASGRPTSAPNSSAPTMGTLLSVMLLLVTNNAFAWTV